MKRIVDYLAEELKAEPAIDYLAEEACCLPGFDTYGFAILKREQAKQQRSGLVAAGR